MLNNDVNEFDKYPALKEFLETNDEDYECLEEGFIGDKVREFKRNRKQKKYIKKRDKIIKQLPILSHDESIEAVAEFELLVKQVEDIINKEIPGASFNNISIDYDKFDLGNGYSIHEYNLDLIDFSGRNRDRFVDNSDDKILRTSYYVNKHIKIANTVKYVYDKSHENTSKRDNIDVAVTATRLTADVASKELLNKEIDKRINIPISKLNLKNVGSMYIRNKNNREFISVKLHDGVILQMAFVTKNETV